MRKIPTHERTYNRLSEMILFGQLAPGQAVTASWSREAMIRLQEER